MNWRDSIWVQDSVTRRRSQSMLKLCSVSFPIQRTRVTRVTRDVFAVPKYASNIIKAAITNNIRDKVWIASETWAMNKQLPREPGIGEFGTVIGITERLLTLPGFNDGSN